MSDATDNFERLMVERMEQFRAQAPGPVEATELLSLLLETQQHVLHTLGCLRNELYQIHLEVRTMTTQETQLTQAVADLSAAFTDLNDHASSLEAAIATLKSAVATPSIEPSVLTASINNIESIATQMKAATTAAQAALPVVTATAGPTPVPVTGASATPATGTSAEPATGTSAAAPATGTDAAVGTSAAG